MKINDENFYAERKSVFLRNTNPLESIYMN